MTAERVCAELLAEVLTRFGEVRLRAQGSSMLPAVRPGDVLVVRREPLERVQSGDLVLYVRDQRLFAHRVVDVRDGNVLAKGDCLEQPDPPVAAAQVLGRVRALVREEKEILLDTDARRRLGRWLSRLSALGELWWLAARAHTRLTRKLVAAS
jgi:signal peptidase